ncbi:MAG: hypothetical protein RIQ60_4283 [Pseudomonadota bacterium]|jgi:ribosome biogenesis GTPase A
MSIQWFPGHMNSTKKAIVERLPDIDVVIELLDARLPGSSANPLLAELTTGKPALKVLNKQDLAEPALTAAWLAHYLAQPGTRAIGLDASEAAPARRLIAECRALAPLRGGMVKPLRVLICGVPNVGKSTLINTLVGQRSAKTGDEPGITKVEQRITLASDFYLYDTPGMLWPRIAVEHSGWHLAAAGSIGRNAYDEVDVALALLASVRPLHEARLLARYKLDAAQLAKAPPPLAGAWAEHHAQQQAGHIVGAQDAGQRHASEAELALLAHIGRKRGALIAGSQVLLHKAAEVVINDFRAGAWGRLTLESPEQFVQWTEQARLRDAERAARRAARGRRNKSDSAVGEDAEPAVDDAAD